jgi:hypothetical protein
MKLYAEVTGVRVRQIVFDVLLVVWVYAWIRVGMRVHDLVDKLATPGARMEEAGGSFAGSASRLGGRADDLPIVGHRLGDAFGTIVDGGRALQRAGVAQQDAVHALALWLGVLLALIPIAWALFRYLPGRVRWVREASAAARLRASGADLRLFAPPGPRRCPAQRAAAGERGSCRRLRGGAVRGPGGRGAAITWAANMTGRPRPVRGLRLASAFRS